MKITILIIQLLLIIISSLKESMAVQIALTFDDTPGGDTFLFTGRERTQKLIKELAINNVKEVGLFCNTQNFSLDIQERLNMYSESGHIIANHTARHLDYQNSSYEEFINDINEADEKLQQFKGYQRLFRFPYLSQGREEFKRRQINDYLSSQNYQHGYITVETFDWHLNELLQQDLKNGVILDWNKVKKVYLKVMKESIDFYDQMAKILIQRSPRHIILLHENDLNARFIGDLIKLIRESEGEIISLSEALQDPLADEKWDQIAFSQRRIRGIARQVGYSGALFSPWEDIHNLSQLYLREVHQQ